MKLKLYNRVFVLTWLHLEINNLFTQMELPLYTERLKKMHLPGGFCVFLFDTNSEQLNQTQFMIIEF